MTASAAQRVLDVYKRQEDINLHFTGDIHAIGTANNLLAAMIDNSIQQGNPLNIDPRRITWKRCMDMNDRQLRFIVEMCIRDRAGGGCEKGPRGSQPRPPVPHQR